MSHRQFLQRLGHGLALDGPTTADHDLQPVLATACVNTPRSWPATWHSGLLMCTREAARLALWAPAVRTLLEA